MCAKDRRSHDQKRKAKLASRTKRHEDKIQPYSGEKYRADRWLPHVYETELGVYETIKLSHQRLTNAEVEAAFVQLIKRLRGGLPGPLQEDEPEVAFAEGNAVEYLIWNIRRHWKIMFQQRGPVSTEDLVGILRTLLFSMKAQAWNLGPERGYVAFLERFMEGQF
jgi:hypothetical protein